MSSIQTAESQVLIQSEFRLDPAFYENKSLLVRWNSPESTTLGASGDPRILEPLLDIARLKCIDQFTYLATEKSVE